LGENVSRPNLGIGMAGCPKLSTPALDLGREASRPNLWLGLDVSTSTPKLGLDASVPIHMC
jgi:hypothetical protein